MEDNENTKPVPNVLPEYEFIKGLIIAGKLPEAPLEAEKVSDKVLEVEAEMEALQVARLEQNKLLTDKIFQGKIPIKIPERIKPPVKPIVPGEYLKVNQPIQRFICKLGRPRIICKCSNQLEICNKYICKLSEENG